MGLNTGPAMKQLSAGLRLYVATAVRDNPGAMVSVVDEDDKFRYVSGSSLALFGYPPAAVVGHPITEFFGRLDADHLRLVIQDAILNGESVSPAREVRLKFGGVKCMHGPALGLIDRQTGRAYALTIGRPCND